MYPVPNLTDAPSQSQTLTLPDGSQIFLEIRFVQSQLGWFITEISYPNTNFTLHGFRIVTSACCLYQYRNKIPFGLACISPSGREPTQIEDFASGASQLFILTADEVNQFANLLSGQVQP